MAFTLALQRDIVSLTDTQVKALPTTPVTLIAAPGAGYRIKLICAPSLRANIVGAYTNINATYSELKIEYASHTLGSIITDSGASMTDLNTVLGTVQETITDVAPSVLTSWTAAAVPMLAANADNDLIRISIDNSGSGALTGGNASNSVKVTLTYLIEPT